MRRNYYTYGEQQAPAAAALSSGALGSMPMEAEGPGMMEPPPAEGPAPQGALAEGGRDDTVPAMLSNGEYVIDAETVSLLGDGSAEEGARRLDAWRESIWRDKGDAMSKGQPSPDAQQPEEYMG